MTTFQRQSAKLLLSQLLKSLLGRTRSRDRCWAAIRLSHRPKPLGHAVHGEVDGADIGGQHGRRFVLLRHTHRPQRRLYPIWISRSGNVRHRCEGSKAPDPGFSCEDHSWWVGAGDENAESAHSAFHWWSAHCAARMLLPDELMRCCAAGANGCLDLRRRVFALDGRVSAGWSRCPGSMARRAKDSVAPLRWSSAGWMPARIGTLSAGVRRRHPVTIRRASLTAGMSTAAPHRRAVLYGWMDQG